MPPVVAFDADVLGRRRTGDETWAREVLEALAALRLPFRILAYLRDPAALPPSVSASDTIVPVALPVASNYARGLLALPARLHTDRPALFHGNYLLPPSLPCPGVVTVHDCSFLRRGEFMPWHDRAAFRRFVPWSARRAARVVTVSEFTRRDLLALMPELDPARVVAIPSGVSPEFRPMPDAAAVVRREFGIEEPYVLFLGALQARKNLARLLDAWQTMRARRPDRPEILVLAGGDKTGVAEEIDRMAARKGLAPHVRRLGYVDGRASLRALIAGAKALAFPSLYEGFGLPVLEAMACGTPVVASNVTALPEVCGDAAVLVDPEDAGSIAAGLERLLDDSEVHACHRVRGLERARQFTWKRTAERLAEVWLDALEPRQARSRPTAQPCASAAAPVVTVSIVSTGEAELLAPCLAAVRAQDVRATVRPVVVCNSPGDGSAALVRRSFPDALVVEQSRRMGFSANHNRGHREAPSDFVLVMNPDVVLEPGCLRAMLAHMAENPRCGMVAPLLLYADGRPQPSARCFPRPLGTLLRRTPLRSVLPPARHDASHYLPVPVTARMVDWALGACLLVRRTAWDEIGGFDERTFTRLYVEDIDLGWRLWQAGWEVWQTPDAVAIHEHQAASDKRFFHRRTLWHFHGMWGFVRRHPSVLAGLAPALARSRAVSNSG